MNKRTTFKVLGRNVGSATGWDENGEQSIILYEFQPVAEFKIPSDEDTCFSFETGKIEQYNEDGSVKLSVDMIALLQPLSIVD